MDDDESEVYPDNVIPIRQEVMFVFPPEELPTENGPFSIELGALINEASIITRRIGGITRRSDAVERLRAIGRSWNSCRRYLGSLKDKDGKEIAYLELHRDGYDVVDLEAEEGVD